MGVQLIFVVEADEKSRSDYIYIKSIVDEIYGTQQSNDIKLSPVFMGGKGNYKKNSILKQINNLQKAYKRNGETKVIYCFDTDKYESNVGNKNELSMEEKFCRDNSYEFAWFCHDVEEVFLGRSVDDSKKTEEARHYLSGEGVRNVKVDNLRSETMSKCKSNLLSVVDKCLEQ